MPVTQTSFLLLDSANYYLELSFQMSLDIKGHAQTEYLNHDYQRGDCNVGSQTRRLPRFMLHSIACGPLNSPNKSIRGVSCVA